MFNYGKLREGNLNVLPFPAGVLELKSVPVPDLKPTYVRIK